MAWNVDKRTATYPIALPTDHIAEVKAKALATLVGSVISPSMAFVTATFPFNTPAVHRLK